MIEHELTFASPRAPDEVFAYLADVARTPEWLSTCVRVEVLSPGAVRLGTALRYTYRQLSRTGHLEGSVTTFEPARSLRFAYADTMLAITVGFEITQGSGRTRVLHTIAIEPRSPMMRLFQPLIRREVVRQAALDVATLARLLCRTT